MLQLAVHEFREKTRAIFNSDTKLNITIEGLPLADLEAIQESKDELVMYETKAFVTNKVVSTIDLQFPKSGGYPIHLSNQLINQ